MKDCYVLTRPKMPFKVVHRKEVTHPGRWKSEEVAQALRRVYITAWKFEGNIRPTQLRTVGDRREGGQAVQWKTAVDAV